MSTNLNEDVKSGSSISKGRWESKGKFIEWEVLLQIREKVGARSHEEWEFGSNDNFPDDRKYDSPPGEQTTRNVGSEKSGDSGEGGADPGLEGWKGEDRVQTAGKLSAHCQVIPRNKMET